MKSAPLRVASVQMESAPGDREANFAKIERFAAEAAAAGAGLVVFPECCITGYWFIRNLSPQELAALAEPVP
ncbi:MAG: acyltransferase, partial [Verrucomicrobiaceae bacterium]